jgi:hypothetical protein
MARIVESPGVFRARLLFTFILFVVLSLLAHGVAELAGWIDSGTGPTGLHYRAVFTLWVAIVLATPAICAYIFLRPGEHNGYWLGFWTASYLAFLCHLYWSVFGETGITVKVGQVIELVLAGWWTLDVLLAWFISWDVKGVQLQRGALHLFVFVVLFAAAVLAGSSGIITILLGLLMALIVAACLVIRLAVREADPKSLLHTLFVQGFQALNWLLPWYRLPTFLAVQNLGALRDVLRAKNLHNTSDIPVTLPEGLRAPPPFKAEYLSEREEDGFYNELRPDKVDMGSASLNRQEENNSSDFTLSRPGARFGRNIPLDAVGPLPSEKVTEPSPRLISNNLLARPQGTFTSASTLNLLAAAWIQFQVHDWFNHGSPVRGNEFEVPLPTGDNWPHNPMRIRRTRPDPTRTDPNRSFPLDGPADGYKPTYANAESHWWDGSEIYGSSKSAADRLRSGENGKIRVKNGMVEVDGAGIEQTGLSVNWWIGLSILHNLFTLEHNAICDCLKREYSEWSDNDLYRTARLVNTALMAKIHTIDWTPAILGHPALQVGMPINWWGIAGEQIKKAFGRISDSEAVSGIPGSETNHHTADYCLTEEFVSVYRMHPLMPDGIDLHSAVDGRLLRNLKLGSEIDDDPDDVVGPHARDRALAHGSMTDLIYSFGVGNPGALVLGNYPNWMRRLRRMKGSQVDEIIDLAAIDILRDRERGVPRYNRFRRLFHLPPFRNLDHMIRASKQLRETPKLAEQVRAIYKGDIEQVDLMVGLYAETPPEGFGFSDTAFRVFILMASRRLKSDRFFTRDYTPAVYSRAGLDWVENNDMRSVLLRHFPSLTPAIQSVANPFAPWQHVEQAAKVRHNA